MLLPYMDKLDSERQQVFEKLAAFKDQFILAGGTAIMLQMGHRKSFDFDCFTEKELPQNILPKAKRVFGRYLFRLVETSEMLTIKTSKNIEVTFVFHPYKPLRKPLATYSISIFHLDDLVANKAYTIGRRGVWRDYVDLFFFLKWKLYDIDTLINLAKEKFSGEFNEKLFLEQLVYFDDLDIIPIQFLKESYQPEYIQSFLGKATKGYLAKVLK